MALLCGVWCQSCFRSQSPGLSSWEIALYNNPCFTSPSLWWRSRLRLSARTALPPLRPTLCLFLRLFSAALLSHSPSPLFHTEAIISPARASRLASSTLGSTSPPPLVGEAVGGWRPCGAGLLLGLRFFRGLGAIHISRESTYLRPANGLSPILTLLCLSSLLGKLRGSVSGKSSCCFCADKPCTTHRYHKKTQSRVH